MSNENTHTPEVGQIRINTNGNFQNYYKITKLSAAMLWYFRCDKHGSALNDKVYKIWTKNADLYLGETYIWASRSKYTKRAKKRNASKKHFLNFINQSKMANINFEVGQIYHVPKFGTIKIVSQCGKNTYNVVDCDLDGNALGDTLRVTTNRALIGYILVTPENRAALAACITRDLELEKVTSNLWVQYRNENDKDNKDNLMRQIKQYQAL